ncbi:hypothetical protein V8G54_037380 [Vigna mungo]|uniref:Uncharacterized protein n=1 Tax=Vigna mungo TaxID=3915 RepID=A0AAQ3MJ13_VIGMU
MTCCHITTLTCYHNLLQQSETLIPNQTLGRRLQPPHHQQAPCRCTITSGQHPPSTKQSQIADAFVVIQTPWTLHLRHQSRTTMEVCSFAQPTNRKPRIARP